MKFLGRLSAGSGCEESVLCLYISVGLTFTEPPGVPGIVLSASCPGVLTVGALLGGNGVGGTAQMPVHPSCLPSGRSAGICHP